MLWIITLSGSGVKVARYPIPGYTGSVIVGVSLTHSYVETCVKMVGWSMRDKQRRKTGMQYTSVVW